MAASDMFIPEYEKQQFIRLWEVEVASIFTICKTLRRSKKTIHKMVHILGLQPRPCRERKEHKRKGKRGLFATSFSLGRLRSLRRDPQPTNYRSPEGEETDLLHVHDGQCRELTGDYAGRNNPICCGKQVKPGYSFCECHYKINFYQKEPEQALT